MAACEKVAKGEKNEVGKALTMQDSISALVVSFYKTSDSKGLSDSTKTTYRGIIERFRADHGHGLVKETQRDHVQKIVAKNSETPAAANNMLRMIDLLMRHAVELSWRGDEPIQGFRKVRNKTDGFLTWEEEHIAAFEAHHKPGIRARLALCLLLYLGQRRSGRARMGRQHLRIGVLSITQQKTV